MDPDSNATGSSQCGIRMLPFVAVAIVLAIFSVWLLTWVDHLLHNPRGNNTHRR